MARSRARRFSKSASSRDAPSSLGELAACTDEPHARARPVVLGHDPRERVAGRAQVVGTNVGDAMGGADHLDLTPELHRRRRRTREDETAGEREENDHGMEARHAVAVPRRVRRRA